MIQELFDLTDKVVLVTGGTHGIGMAVGTVLGQAGAQICVNDIDEAKLESAKEEYAANGHILYVDGGILANFGYVKGENEI